MRGPAIRLGGVLVGLALLAQLALPSYLEHRVADRLTAHGGSAHVDLGAIPSVRLLFGEGHDLRIRARGLSFDLPQGQRDVFKRLDGFDHVTIGITDSRAGPFTVSSFLLTRRGPHLFDAAVAADATAGDIARYAGDQLAGGFGASLAALATSAVGAFERPVPIDVRMTIDTRTSPPQAAEVQGDVAGLPAGPLMQIVTNALLTAV